MLQHCATLQWLAMLPPRRNVFFDTTDMSAACQLSDGRRFPGPPPPRSRLPAWAGALIGIGVTMLVVMCVIAWLLWRRRQRRSRRRDLEVHSGPSWLNGWRSRVWAGGSVSWTGVDGHSRSCRCS